MPKILTVGTEDFDFPIEGDNANYGSSITDWATAVTDGLTTVVQPNDITVTTASINNNVLVATPIPGFLFDTSEVISINAEAIVTRSTTSPAEIRCENVYINGNFNGTDWAVTVQTIAGIDSGVTFDINSSGQVTYISDNMAGTGYVGQIVFKAKVFNQPE